MIKTDLDLRGRGTEDSPVRRVTQYWTLEGELLAEVDPYEEAVRRAERQKAEDGL